MTMKFGLSLCLCDDIASGCPTRATAECVGVVGRNGEHLPVCLQQCAASHKLFVYPSVPSLRMGGDEVHGGSPVESSDYSRTFESHYIYCARVVSFAALLGGFINSDRHTLVSLRMVALVAHVLIMHMCLCVFKSCCRPFSFHASRPVCRFSFICIFGDLVTKITR